MKTRAITLAMFVGTAFVGSAAAQDSGCATPGSMALNDIAEKREDITPSLHRQLSALGRTAYANNCSVVITCASDPSDGDESSSIRWRKCGAAKFAVPMFDQRYSKRRLIFPNYEIRRVNPNSSIAAGQVVVQLN